MSEAVLDQHESTPLAETPDVYGAYPRLSDDQVAILGKAVPGAPSSRVRRSCARVSAPTSFFVILSGKVAVSTPTTRAISA